MNKQEIENIQEVCAKATPGPWEINRDDIGDEIYCYAPTDIISEQGITIVDYEGGLAPCNQMWRLEDIEANAQFIALSRTALPQLAEQCLGMLEVVEAARDIYEIITNGLCDFRNGVSAYGVDEGEEQARPYVKALGQALEKLGV